MEAVKKLIRCLVVVNPQVMETTEVIGEEGDNKVTPINKGKRMDVKKQHERYG